VEDEIGVHASRNSISICEPAEPLQWAENETTTDLVSKHSHFPLKPGAIGGLLVVAFVTEDMIKHKSPGMLTTRYGRPASGDACIERLPYPRKRGEGSNLKGRWASLTGVKARQNHAGRVGLRILVLWPPGLEGRLAHL